MVKKSCNYIRTTFRSGNNFSLIVKSETKSERGTPLLQVSHEASHPIVPFSFDGMNPSQLYLVVPNKSRYISNIREYIDECLLLK